MQLLKTIFSCLAKLDNLAATHLAEPLVHSIAVVKLFYYPHSCIPSGQPHSLDLFAGVGAATAAAPASALTLVLVLFAVHPFVISSQIPRPLCDI